MFSVDTYNTVHVVVWGVNAPLRSGGAQRRKGLMCCDGTKTQASREKFLYGIKRFLSV